MGGLDGRYLIWYLQQQRENPLSKTIYNHQENIQEMKERLDLLKNVKVHSLTTLATPHTGSLIAQYCIDILEGKRNLKFQPISNGEANEPSKDSTNQAMNDGFSFFGNLSNGLANGTQSIGFQFLTWLLYRLVTPALLYEDEITSKNFHPDFMTNNPKYSYEEKSTENETSSSYTNMLSQRNDIAKKKEIFIKRSLTHLTEDWLQNIFNVHIAPRPLIGTYCTSYAGDITPLLKDIQDNVSAIDTEKLAQEDPPPDSVLPGVNYPWNVTYPALLQHEKDKYPDVKILGNDGLVSVNSSLYFPQGKNPDESNKEAQENLEQEYNQVWPVLHPNFSRDWVVPLSFRKPTRPPPSVLPLYDLILQDLARYESS